LIFKSSDLSMLAIIVGIRKLFKKLADSN